MVPLSFKYLLSLIINAQFHKLISGHAILNFTTNVAAIWRKSAEKRQCNLKNG